MNSERRKVQLKQLGVLYGHICALRGQVRYQSEKAILDALWAIYELLAEVPE